MEWTIFVVFIIGAIVGFAVSEGYKRGVAGTVVEELGKLFRYNYPDGHIVIKWGDGHVTEIGETKNPRHFDKPSTPRPDNGFLNPDDSEVKHE